MMIWILALSFLVTIGKSQKIASLQPIPSKWKSKRYLSANGFDCPAPGGLYPNPADSTCATYYHCNRGRPHKKPCPPGLIFDPSSKTCNWSWAYKCPGGSGPAPTTAKTTSATQQYPEPDTTPWQPSKPSGNSCNKKIVCYYPNWAHYRKGT